MKTIYKYFVPLGSVLILDLSKDAKTLAFMEQGGHLCAWIELETNAPETRPRHYTVLGTGWEVPPGFDHVASCQQGPFVWHLYERKSPL
jgi:hypothetical protein